MPRGYTVSYKNSTMFGKKLANGRYDFLEVEESVTAEQYERLKSMPFVKNLKVLRLLD